MMAATRGLITNAVADVALLAVGWFVCDVAFDAVLVVARAGMSMSWWL